MNLTKNQLKVLKALKNPNYWKPSFTEISREIKVPISTIYEIHQKFKCNFIMDMKIEAPDELKKLMGVFEPVK